MDTKPDEQKSVNSGSKPARGALDRVSRGRVISQVGLARTGGSTRGQRSDRRGRDAPAGTAPRGGGLAAGRWLVASQVDPGVVVSGDGRAHRHSNQSGDDESCASIDRRPAGPTAAGPAMPVADVPEPMLRIMSAMRRATAIHSFTFARRRSRTRCGWCRRRPGRACRCSLRRLTSARPRLGPGPAESAPRSNGISPCAVHRGL